MAGTASSVTRKPCVRKLTIAGGSSPSSSVLGPTVGSRRRPRPKHEKRRREPEEPGPEGGEHENEIRVAEQARIVSAEADER